MKVIIANCTIIPIFIKSNGGFSSSSKRLLLTISSFLCTPLSLFCLRDDVLMQFRLLVYYFYISGEALLMLLQLLFYSSEFLMKAKSGAGSKRLS